MTETGWIPARIENMPITVLDSFDLELFQRQINWRDENSFCFAQEIHKPYGEIDVILQWCKTELVNEWRWQMIDMSGVDRPGRYIFYFDGELDCLAFTLKWA